MTESQPQEAPATPESDPAPTENPTVQESDNAVESDTVQVESMKESVNVGDIRIDSDGLPFIVTDVNEQDGTVLGTAFHTDGSTYTVRIEPNTDDNAAH